LSVHPYGPLTKEQFQEAVDAPYGRAGDILRKGDPLWGRGFPDGEVKRWKVTYHQQVTMAATKYVEAASEKEAEAIADTISDDTLTFDRFVDADSSEIISVEVADV